VSPNIGTPIQSIVSNDSCHMFVPRGRKRA
jgi:hypothetical protein